MSEAGHERTLERLEFLYGRETARRTLDSILRLVAGYRPTAPVRVPLWSENDALLISYGDSILDEGAAPLASLDGFLRDRVGGLVTMLHLLPFYPYSSDDGFAVTDFRAVNPALGTWEDIRALARDYRLVFDGVINHVSASSIYMEGYSKGNPDFADFFLALSPEADTSKVFRTRNLPLLHKFDTANGSRRLWTTFGPDQVDLNFGNPRVLLEILDVLLFYASKGASVIRLDAIPYLWKELGTTCVHLPQTHELIKLIRDVYDLTFPHVLLLTETNVPHRENVSYFGDRGDEAQIIYNFSLPPLIVLALARGDSTTLTKLAGSVEYVGPRATYLNITATHDGIGMRPTEGLLGEAERKQLVDLAYAHNGQVSGKRNSDGSVSPYELNLNYFDAVNDPNADEPADVQVRRFMVSQAIALAFLGIPGIYIHSLLGSRNDTAAVKETGIARRINRARLKRGALDAELSNAGSIRSRVFSEYARLLSIRRREKAFHPDSAQEILDLGPSVFALRRRSAESGEDILAIHNVTPRPVSVDLGPVTRKRPCVDLLAGGNGGGRMNNVSGSGVLELRAYAVSWLKMGF